MEYENKAEKMNMGSGPDCSNKFKKFSLKGKYIYQVQYVNIIGDMDYQVNYKLAEEYYNKMNAPKKEIYIMKDARHGRMASK